MICRIVEFIASIAIAALLSSAASAQACQPRLDLLKSLKTSHNEVPRAHGLKSTGTVVEVLWSETGSWSLIITGTNGISCIVYAGEAWELIPPPLPPKI